MGWPGDTLGRDHPWRDLMEEGSEGVMEREGKGGRDGGSGEGRE